MDEGRPQAPILVPERGLKVSWGLGAIGCFAALICIFAALVLPVIQSAGASLESSSCAANLRQVGRAMLLYAEQNAGKLPGAGWNEDLIAIEPDRVLYACPRQRRLDPRSSGYALSSEVAGKKLDSIQDPGSVVLVFDSLPTVPGAIAKPNEVPRPGRHRNGSMNNVVYVDGHGAPVPAN